MSNPPPDPTQQASPFAGFSRLTRILGQVVAPTTLLTALLFYFGWAHVYFFFDYFGVDSSVLGASTRDYVMRSVDALFIPVITAGAVGLGLMWGYVALPERARRGPTSRWQLLTLAILGVLLVLNGAIRLFWKNPLNTALCVAPICLIVGIGLLWYLVLLRRNRIGLTHRSEAAILTEWAVMFTVVAISLFWIAADYSIRVGQSRALEQEAQLPGRPEAILFSEKDLHLDANDVTTTACRMGPDTESAYHFRYEGLVLLIEIGGQYVLVPRDWARGHGAAIVLPKSGLGAMRLEFATDGYQPSAAC